MKTRLQLLTLLALFVGLLSCSKEEPLNSSNLEDIEARTIFNFNITVDAHVVSSTKGVKDAWEAADVIYVFFENNTAQYLKMTFNGTSWDYKDKNGGSSFSGLTLSESGKKISAVYFPSHVNTAPPTVVGSAFVFEQAQSGYFLKAEQVPYTVKLAGNITTLEARLTMKAPEGFVQLFVEDNNPVANNYVITERNFSPATCGAIIPGGNISTNVGSEGFPLTGLPATIKGEKGYYFYGILKSSCRNVSTKYYFQMLQHSDWNGNRYVSSVKAKDAVTTTMYVVENDVVSRAAFRLGNWKESYFLDLGFGSIKWAIGNLQESSPYIAQPLERGNYYMWGRTNAYSSSNSQYTGVYVKESTDPAYKKNTAWRLPTPNEMSDIANSANMTWTWVSVNNSTQQGSYLVTSKKNGLSMVFLTAGYYWEGRLLAEGHIGNFWAAAHHDNDTGRCMVFIGPGSPASPSSMTTEGGCYRKMGMSIRAVMER